MADEGVQEPQEGQEPEPQQPQQIDPRQALEIAAQQYGMTPDQLEGALRLQEENQRVYEENRRRTRELELERVRVEALASERSRYAPPPASYDDMDPQTRRIFEKLDRLDNRFDEQERRNQSEREAQLEAQRLGSELENNYKSVMRGVPSQNQVDQQKFFAAMAELWPNALPPEITPAIAVARTARYLGLQTNGAAANYAPQRANPYRDPRAQIVIPSQGGGPNTSETTNGPDFGAQRSGETTEQYHARLKRSFQDSGFSASGLMPDKSRLSSG